MKEFTPAHIKICGVTLEEQVQLVSDLGFGAIGFVLYEKSPRYVSPKKVAELTSKISPFIKKVAVVVNVTVDEIRNLWLTNLFDYFQLHGDESPEYCTTLQNDGIPFIKAFRMKKAAEIPRLNEYPGGFFLTDAYHQNQYGGTGVAFDWDLLKKFSDEKQIILSGGITCDNIKQACDIPHIVGFDLSSGVEVSPGIKSPDKLKYLVQLMSDKP